MQKVYLLVEELGTVDDNTHHNTILSAHLSKTTAEAIRDQNVEGCKSRSHDVTVYYCWDCECGWYVDEMEVQP